MKYSIIRLGGIVTRKTQKVAEQRITTAFMKTVYGFEPKFIELKVEHPDCYFEYNGDLYAVEVSSYFSQDEIKQR